PLALFSAFRLRVVALALELDVRAIGQELQRLHEVEPLRLLDEVEDVALLTAAEAEEHLFRGVDRERRAALVVKRAKTDPLAPHPPQIRPLGDEAVEVDRV